MNKFSIITINLNNALGLEKTINSVINQTFSSYEYIIIDGGSDDGSVDLIRRYRLYLSFWQSENDSGVYNAMNKGILKATGEYLIFMNSGDKFHSNTVLEDIYNSDISTDIIMGREYLGNDGPYGFSKQQISMMDLFHRPLQHQSTFFKRTLFEKYLYDENYKIISDWKFAIQSIIFDNCSFSTTDIVVDDFDDNGLSSNKEQGDYESSKMFQELLLPRILQDYKKYTHLDDEWVLLGHQLYYTRNFKRFVYVIVKVFLKIRSFCKLKIHE